MVLGIYKVFHLVAPTKIKTIVAINNYSFSRLSELRLVNNTYNVRLGGKMVR